MRDIFASSVMHVMRDEEHEEIRSLSNHIYVVYLMAGELGFHH